MNPLPTGTVTFVFTDIEGSTSMLQRLGDAFVDVLEDHHRIMREAFTAGFEVSSEGDAFFFAFPSAAEAVKSACRAQRSLAEFAWPQGSTVMVRMGIHTGEGVKGGDNYVGLDVHRAARIAAAGHGGQILLSDATRMLSGPALTAEITLADLGEHRFKDLDQPEHVYQVVIRGLPSDFPPIVSLDAAPNNLRHLGMAGFKHSSWSHQRRGGHVRGVVRGPGAVSTATPYHPSGDEPGRETPDQQNQVGRSDR